jgi:putative lipoic acid-binding regulatory protein
MKDPHVEYPCLWTYAIVGKDEEDLRLVAGEVARGAKHHVVFSKLSAKKNYVSLHVEIEVASQEERDRYFDAFKSDPRVKFVL